MVVVFSFSQIPGNQRQSVFNFMRNPKFHAQPKTGGYSCFRPFDILGKCKATLLLFTTL